MASLGFLFGVLALLSLQISHVTSRLSFHQPLLVDDNIHHRNHQEWMTRFSRVYNNELEKKMRFEVFKENSRFIERFNKEWNRTYTLGVNKFADWTEEEFISTHTGLNGVERISPDGWYYDVMVPTWVTYQDADDVTPDPKRESKDWRDEGAVTPVRYQGVCGGCWAFSAVAAVEGMTKIAGGNLVPLSEQQIIDCDNQGYDNGCHGGFISEAFKFILNNGGIGSENDYPYQGYKWMCQGSPNPAASIKGFQGVPSNNERALREAVFKQPVSVSINADGPGFMHYAGGIYDEPYCRTYSNHAITLIGYGTSHDGIKYWLAKNSWGETWGENGYIRIRRDVEWPEGMCGIAQSPFYPVA